MSVYRKVFLLHKTMQSFVLFKRLCHVQTQIASHELMSDLRKIKYIWKLSNRKAKTYICQCYSKNGRSTSYPLELISIACGPADCSLDLVYSMVKSFEDYLKTDSISYTPSFIEKTEILGSVLGYKNYNLLRLVCNIFKITEDAPYFKDFIDRLVQQQKLIEAAFCVSALNLHQEYAVEKILLPLLLEGKVYPAVIYLTNNSDLQLEVVKMLDSLLFKNKKSSAKIVSYVNSRLLFKTLTSLLNEFKIPADHCKNLYYIRSKAAINHLIRRRIEQSVSKSTWQEMVMELIGENEELKEFLIKKLLAKKDAKTATEIAEMLKIPESKLSVLLSTCLEVPDDKTEALEDLCNEIDDTSAVNSDHLTFALKFSDIKLIESKKDFIDCINNISQNYEIIGIDSEWKPHFGLAKERLSLIQLAVHDKVYILDILSLMECLETDDWDKFMDDIFGNPSIIKLGCGIMCDVQMIVQNNLGTKGKAVKFSHIVDMNLFYQKMQEVYPEKMGYCSPEDKNSAKGLSKLCEIILGKPLSKEERLCDWEKRPLRESQIEYAALDAHCLLLMYEKLKQEALEKDMNFSHLSKVAVVLTTQQWKPKKKFRGNKTDKDCYIRPPVHIQHFKIIVDPALCKLGKDLKLFGADVLIPGGSASPEHIVELSKSTKRIIICGEELFKQVNGKVKDGLCFNASLNFGKQIKVPHILQHFNIQLCAKSILPPCASCHSEERIELSLEDRKVFDELKPEEISSEHFFITEHNLKQLSDTLQTTLRDMMKSGINPTFKNICDISNRIEFKILCTNCGTIQ